MESKEYDYINPSHYKQGGKETIEKMVDIWGAENVAIHCEITAFKYMERLGAKPDQPKERDLAKARWYLNKAEELKTKKFAEDIKKAITTPEIVSTIYNHVSSSTIAPTREDDGYSVSTEWSERKKATFKFFNEFPEPYRTQAKDSYDEKFVPEIPENKMRALHGGFDWDLSKQGRDYWAIFRDALERALENE